MHHVNENVCAISLWNQINSKSTQSIIQGKLLSWAELQIFSISVKKPFFFSSFSFFDGGGVRAIMTPYQNIILNAKKKQTTQQTTVAATTGSR